MGHRSTGFGAGGASPQPAAFFTIPHFDGYAAVLIQLRTVSRPALREEGVEVSCLGMRSDADPRWVLRLRQMVTRSRPAIVHAQHRNAALPPNTSMAPPSPLSPFFVWMSTMPAVR